MTTQLTLQPRLFTVAEYLELGEPAFGYTELVEGRVVHTPSPVADHNWAAAEVRDQLRPQLPPGLEAILDVDVAGIPHHWVVDLGDPVSVLAGGFGCVDGGAVTGTFRTTEPFPVELDLDALR